MIDPFASINKTLTSIGAQPIKIGTSVAQTAGKPSTKQLVDDLTAEQRQEARWVELQGYSTTIQDIHMDIERGACTLDSEAL